MGPYKPLQVRTRVDEFIPYIIWKCHGSLDSIPGSSYIDWTNSSAGLSWTHFHRWNVWISHGRLPSHWFFFQKIPLDPPHSIREGLANSFFSKRVAGYVTLPKFNSEFSPEKLPKPNRKPDRQGCNFGFPWRIPMGRTVYLPTWMVGFIFDGRW